LEVVVTSEEPAEYAAARRVFRGDAIRRVVFDMDGPTRVDADGTYVCEGPSLISSMAGARKGRAPRQPDPERPQCPCACTT